MNFLINIRNSSKTFKPRKNVPAGADQLSSSSTDLLSRASVTLGCGNLFQAVRLPHGEDLNEWIANNTVDFFNQINMLYGTLHEFCTEKSCPQMNAGSKYVYYWAADPQNASAKKVHKCSAPRYAENLMSWVQQQIEDESLFPSKIGVPFPKHFLDSAKKILKRLFRVYAHVYHQHFREVCSLQEERHLNTSFKHFVLFVMEFQLVETKELAPLQDLIERIMATKNEIEQEGDSTIDGAPAVSNANLNLPPPHHQQQHCEENPTEPHLASTNNQ